MAKHETHEWGPHKGGIRWVQCQRCEVLLHEPEADLRCDPSGVTLAIGRRERARVMARQFARIARAESGWMPGLDRNMGRGLFQLTERLAFRAFGGRE